MKDRGFWMNGTYLGMIKFIGKNWTIFLKKITLGLINQDLSQWNFKKQIKFFFKPIRIQLTLVSWTRLQRPRVRARPIRWSVRRTIGWCNLVLILGFWRSDWRFFGELLICVLSSSGAVTRWMATCSRCSVPGRESGAYYRRYWPGLVTVLCLSWCDYSLIYFCWHKIYYAINLPLRIVGIFTYSEAEIFDLTSPARSWDLPT